MTIDKPYDLPDILSLNSKDLIDWCNSRKKQMHLSNAKLANMTCVPEGTIDRILTGKNLEFRYSTIQPIVKVLIGINEETPTDQSSDFYTETIDGYKLITQNKNQIITEQQRLYELALKEKDYLRKNNDEKQKLIESLTKHIEWLETQVDKKTSNKKGKDD